MWRGGSCDSPPEIYTSVENRTCLVTGISGMIGSYIAREVGDTVAWYSIVCKYRVACRTTLRVQVACSTRVNFQEPLMCVND